MKKKMTSAACVAAILFFCPFISKAQTTPWTISTNGDAYNTNSNFIGINTQTP